MRFWIPVLLASEAAAVSVPETWRHDDTCGMTVSFLRASPILEIELA